MKKKLTYPLIALVALIWGLIIYRMVHGITNDGSQAPATVRTKTKSMEIRQSEPLPVLKLNYPDPFLEVEVPAKKPEKPVNAVVAAPVEEAVDWSALRYLGAILNPQTGKLVFLLNIAGVDHLMKAGEQNAGVTIVKGNRDAVWLTYQGKQKMIVKE